MYHMFIAVFLKINRHVLILCLFTKVNTVKKAKKAWNIQNIYLLPNQKKYIELKKSGHF